MKVVFFGTPHFAAEVLLYLLKNQVEVVAVITKPDRPQGRSGTPVPTPVKVVSLEQHPPLKVYQPEIVSALDFAPILEAYQADLFVVVAYGEILKQHLLDMPKTACINLHASLLPKYRGAAPIQRSIINGEAETGVTIMHMAKKMDAGDIISMQKIPISENMTYGELETALCREGSALLLKTIRELEKGTATRTVQDHEKATLAPKIELEDCQIDWNQSAQSIHNLVRGVNPHPGAWAAVEINGQMKRLKIITTNLPLEENISQPGRILSVTKQGVLIGCGQGSIYLVQVQPEGKKPMSALEFMRGIPEGKIKMKAEG